MPENTKNGGRGKKHKRIACLIIGLLLLIPIYYFYAWTQQGEVKEAVVRSHFGSSGVVFITFDRLDPSNDFMQRFIGSPVAVRKFSKSRRKVVSLQPRVYVYIDTTTGQKGDYINLHNFSWRGPFKAQVDVDYQYFGKRFTVVRNIKGWFVADEERTWIS